MTIITSIKDFASGKIANLEDHLRSTLIFGNSGSIKLKPESIDQMFSEIKKDLDQGKEESLIQAKKSKPKFHEPLRHTFKGNFNYFI